jgi:hypothetical protein
MNSLQDRGIFITQQYYGFVVALGTLTGIQVQIQEQQKRVGIGITPANPE